MNEILNMISDYNGYIVIGLAGFALVLLIIDIVQGVKLGKTNKKYKSFMSGSDGKSLEEEILKRFEEIDEIKTTNAENQKDIKEIFEQLSICYSKMAMTKYDAFEGMGGKLSFTVALLNSEDNGIVVNSMHSREGCYTYVKEIIRGESFVVLTDEEKKALENAKNKDSIID